ncbi:hypothetical protein ONS95_004589 [Cadophora gregata]|uniref:uncharacterized protein n=1 Tax=Cadophora gregata TaxID=51156 RepID=UPI0026DC33B5|nr:uncharacterized protein ONS95_004589 [Cadophora gregata]KAK0105043.1 hypothetical protein ONS96_004448 [Cadophora gregata f. sp. sojae]KAK0106085.1 hypothetical protein ONS95_004589 [Cadophora gregata]
MLSSNSMDRKIAPSKSQNFHPPQNLTQPSQLFTSAEPVHDVVSSSSTAIMECLDTTAEFTTDIKSNTVIPMPFTEGQRVKELFQLLPPLHIPEKNPTKSFTLFLKLPPELRTFIWKICASQPRNFFLLSWRDEGHATARVQNRDDQPVILQVCRESRAEGFRLYHKCQEHEAIPPDPPETKKMESRIMVRQTLYVNFKVDTFHIIPTYHYPFGVKHFKLPPGGETLIDHVEMKFIKKLFMSPPDTWNIEPIKYIQGLKSLKSVTATLIHSVLPGTASFMDKNVEAWEWEKEIFEEVHKKELSKFPRGLIRYERVEGISRRRIQVLGDEIAEWELSKKGISEVKVLGTI